jgi:tetratricopeptide (TPR) repeat protein
VLNFLGVIPLSQGDFGRAASLFEEGLGVARRVGDRLPIRVSLFNLALSRQAMGDLAGARESLEEGLKLSAEAGDGASAAYFLEGLAGLADDPARAGRLFGAGEALLDAQGGAPVYAYAPDRSRRDRAVAAARSRTDAATFEEAWAQGQSMGLVQAVEYALAAHRTFVKQEANEDVGSAR